jgi:hypothetical protein
VEKWERTGNVYENKGSYPFEAGMYVKTGRLICSFEINQASVYDRKPHIRSAQSSSHLGLNVLELEDLPSFIHQGGRSRWRVDTAAFPTLTTPAHLKQPSVRPTCALVVLTLLRVLAYTLSLVFYHRQGVSQARQTPPPFPEMARLLADLFLPPRMDSS